MSMKFMVRCGVAWSLCWLSLASCAGQDDRAAALTSIDAAVDEQLSGNDLDSVGGSMPEPLPFEVLRIPVGEFVFEALAAGPSDGPVVLLLHGFPQTAYQYRQQLIALAEAGYRAIAPNQRGYSPEARPETVSQYGILLLVQDILGIADALGLPRFHLVGHDWGGGVAWGFSRFFPNRVLSLTVLSTPHPDAMNAELADPTSCQFQASAYFDDFVGDDALEYLRNVGNSADSSLAFECISDDLLDEYLKIINDDDALRAALNWYRANVKDRKFNTPALGPIDVPVLYLWGAEDGVFCHDSAEQTADYVSGDYHFEVLEGVGHWVTDCASDKITELLLEHVATHGG